MTRTNIAPRRSRRDWRRERTSAAWRNYADAMQRLSAARERLAQLSDLMDQCRDEQASAVSDAAEALKEFAIAHDRHVA